MREEEVTVWQNRQQAGFALASALRPWKGKRPLVLAIPRGAVPMAAVVANELGGELGVILVHKIGHPMEPEVAIGSVDEQGRVLALDENRSGVPKETVHALAQPEIARLRKRRELYGGEPPDVKGRSVILVDDGIATGATMLAAVRAVKAGGATEVVVAAPVAARDAAARLRAEADRTVILQVPRFFMAVGQFYVDFRPVEDDEVRALLAARRPAGVA